MLNKSKHIALLTSPYTLIIALGAILFLPMLGAVHLFDWDEINFAESAREMLVTGEYGRVTINFQPFWEKPPLFIWLQTLSMKVFGINEYAARLPNAICGIATLIALFHYGRKYRSAAFGWFWVLTYVGTWLPHVYFKSGIIDPVFNLFMFLGVMQLVQWAEAIANNHRLKHAALTGLFLGLAVLTKGPVGLLLPGLTAVIYIVVKRRWFLQPLPLLVAALVFLASTFAWYGIETIRNGWWFLGAFIEYNLRLAQTKDSGHGGFLLYHFIVLFAGCFPASALLFYKPTDTPEKADEQMPALQNLRLWMWVLLGVVLVVFTIVQTKIIHYSSLAYFPITFLAASTLYRWNQGSFPSPKKLVIVIGIMAGLLGAVLIGGTSYLSTAEGLARVQSIVSQTDAISYGKPWPLYMVAIGLLYAAGATTGAWKMWKGDLMAGAARVFITTAVTVQLIYILLLPYIEPLSQGAMVDFVKEQSSKDVYVDVLGFKSYAQYYYGNKQPNDLTNPAFLDLLSQYKQEHPDEEISPTKFRELETNWYLKGAIDKPVLFVVRARKSEKIQQQHPQLNKIGEGGGFVFLKRDL